MAGLLGISDPDREQALYQGLLGLGAQLMAAGAPTTDPGGGAAALGRGAMGFQQGYQGSMQAAQANRVGQARLAALEADRKAREDRQTAFRGLLDVDPETGTSKAATMGYDPIALGLLGPEGAPQYIASAEAARRAEAADERRFGQQNALLDRRLGAEREMFDARMAAMNRPAPAEPVGPPFAGNGLDASVLNALTAGMSDPAFASSPAYATAYWQASQPKSYQDPRTGQTVFISPDMSMFPRPGAMGGGGGTMAGGPGGMPSAQAGPEFEPMPAEGPLRQPSGPTVTRVGEPRAEVAKPLPASALRMVTDQQEALSIVDGLNADLSRFETLIADGKMPLGFIANQGYEARNAVGMSTPESRNYASFRATLEKMRNDSLRLNNGVQTEGDAQRAWNELIANLNDGDLVLQRLREIRAINERARALRDLQIDTIYNNFGVPRPERGTAAPAASTSPASGATGQGGGNVDLMQKYGLTPPQ